MYYVAAKVKIPVPDLINDFGLSRTHTYGSWLQTYTTR